MKYYYALLLSGLHWLCWIWWERQTKWIDRKVKEKKNVLYRAWQAIQDPAGTPWQPCLLFAEHALWAAGRLCCSLTSSSKYFIFGATKKVEKIIRLTWWYHNLAFNLYMQRGGFWWQQHCGGMGRQPLGTGCLILFISGLEFKKLYTINENTLAIKPKLNFKFKFLSV